MIVSTPSQANRVSLPHRRSHAICKTCGGQEAGDCSPASVAFRTWTLATAA
jgi:hypothetical protein